MCLRQEIRPSSSRSWHGATLLLALTVLPRCATVASELLPRPVSVRTESDVLRQAGEAVATGGLLDARALPVSFTHKELRIQVVGRFECIRSARQERYRIQREIRSLPRASYAVLAAEAAGALVGAVGLARLAARSVVGETEAAVYTIGLPFVPIVAVDAAVLTFRRKTHGPGFETKVGEDLREIERLPCPGEQPVGGWEAVLGEQTARTDSQGVAVFPTAALGEDSLSSDHRVQVWIDGRGSRRHLEFDLPADWLNPALRIEPRTPPEHPAVVEEGAHPLRVEIELANHGLLALRHLVVELAAPPTPLLLHRPRSVQIAEIPPGKTTAAEFEFTLRGPLETDAEFAYSILCRTADGRTLAVAPLNLRAVRRRLPSFRATLREPAGGRSASSRREIEVVIDIANDGPGTARNVKVEILNPAEAQASDFSLFKNPFDTVGDVPPGKSAAARFFMRAGRDFPTNGLSIRIREAGVPRAAETVLTVLPEPRP